MANANFFSPDGGTTRYPLEDTEGRIMYAEEVHGINLLDINLADLKALNTSGTWNNNAYTYNGVTFTVNSNNSLSCDNTSNNTSTFKLSLGYAMKAGTYKLSGAPKQSGNDYRIYIEDSKTGGSDFIYRDLGDGVEFTLENDVQCNIAITIMNGVNMSGKVFEPMITEAKYAGIPYRPYNQQSIQHQINDMNENGAVNHLDNKTTDMTISGITFTVDDNKIIYANGTSTNSGASPQIAMPVSLPKGRWVYSGCPDGGGEQKWDMILWDETTSSRLVGGALFNSNDRLEFEITDANVNHSINAYVRVHKGGVVCNNIAFKPMIAPTSYTGSYVPYAMTNRELTPIKNTLSATTDANGYIYTSFLAQNMKCISPYCSTKIVTPFVNGAGYWVFKVMNLDGTTFANSAVEIVYFTQPV